MRLHRFFIDQTLVEGPLSVENRDLCHQWASVLRMKAGDRLIVCDGKGHQAEAMIEMLTAKTALLRAQSPMQIEAEPRRRITLACAMLKRENFEWVVQKATEAGATTIVPLITTRTVKTGLRQDRLQRIAREAAEQSGRGMIPPIAEPVAFDMFLASRKLGLGIECGIVNEPDPGPNPVIFFHCGLEGSTWVRDIAKAEAATCLIGPEGGWSDEEEALALQHGCISGSLGSLTLRAETAAVIATYRMVQNV